MILTLEKKILLFILGCLLIVMGTVWYGQMAFGWLPCPLCLYQQYLYLATILLTSIGLLAPNHALTRTILVGTGILLSINALVAFYHVGVELQWFPLPPTCQINSSSASTVEELRQQILGTQPAECDKPQAYIFGLSLAAYSFLLSVALSALGFYFALRRPGKRT